DKIMNVDHGEYQNLVNELRRALLKTSRQHLHSEKVKTIELAFEVANHAHYGQFRKSGEPYITHPIEVATFIAEWGLDEQTIAGALMHDVIEDTPVTKEEIARIFNPSIAELVDSVTKLDKLNFESEEIAHAEYFRKVVLAMAKDVRVIIIKLADRMHNMLTLGSMRKEKQRRIALETMEIYVPIANRIGLHKVHLDLANESFKYLYPTRFEILTKATEAAQSQREPITQDILHKIQSSLNSNAIKGEIILRQRTIYNLYSRMVRAKESFNRIYDFFEIKIIVNTIGDCYLTLGVIHSLYQPIPGKFKDYIAVPKNNGYQSLHSTTMGPNGTPIQIHIRTKEMEEVAEQGVISHWLKQQNDHEYDYQAAKKQTSSWLNNILDIQSSTFTASDFLDNIKKDLSPQSIYVFTPKGKIIHLPKGATPLDFAYAIHTDIGDHCQRAKVNQKYVPLYRKLKNGDIIDILTSPEREPEVEWLNFVVSGKAISKIKSYFKEIRFDEEVNVGLNRLNQGLLIAGHDTMIDKESLSSFVSKNYRNMTVENFLQEVGSSEIPVLAAVHSYLDLEKNEPIKISLSRCSKTPIVQDDSCYPLPDEDICATLNRNGELEIHRTKCYKLRGIGLDKLTKVTIINDIGIELLASVIITISNSPGTFSKLSGILAERKINMEEIHQDRSTIQDQVVVKLTITTHSSNEVNNLLEHLSEYNFVISAYRL
ncbi:MAG: RelA/SpoT family protein, partial [Burkholderiales bacterium]|nr:RelA/SpoT family protein [Burkholderiales bacterium]